MKLTDSIIKAAKPKDKRYNLPDGKELALWVQSQTVRKQDECGMTMQIIGNVFVISLPMDERAWQAMTENQAYLLASLSRNVST